MKELRKYLTINAIFSAISGLTMILFSGTINQLFNIDKINIFPWVGVNLLVFALFVWFVSIKQLSNKVLVRTITVLDLFWVLSSFIIVFFAPFGISIIGNIIISLIAVWISFLAYKQHINSSGTE